MDNAIKPIQTAYNGYLFRSRLEARWAVFFDAQGIPYEYEKEGFDLGPDGYYLPDFWLSQFKAWVEIKGQEPTEAEKQRCKRLAELGDDVYIFYGPIGEGKAMAYGRTRSGEVVQLQLGTGTGPVCSQTANSFIKARRARFEYDAAKPGVRYEHRP